MTYASGTNDARTFTYAWDYDTGLLTSETDSDNNVTIAYTYDQLGRILTVTEAGLRRTETVYDDDDRMVRVESDLVTLDDGKLQSVTHDDELGRVVLTRVTDGPRSARVRRRPTASRSQRPTSPPRGVAGLLRLA